MLQSTQLQTRPITTPRPVQPNYIETAAITTTTKRSQDLYRLGEQLRRSEGQSRAAWAILTKAGKAISIANTRAAQLYTENLPMQHQINEITIPKPRKRVVVEPNKRFAKV